MKDNEGKNETGEREGETEEKKAQDGSRPRTRRALPGHPAASGPVASLVPTSFVSGINTPPGKRAPRAAWEDRVGMARPGPYGEAHTPGPGVGCALRGT